MATDLERVRALFDDLGITYSLEDGFPDDKKRGIHKTLNIYGGTGFNITGHAEAVFGFSEDGDFVRLRLWSD